MTNRVSGIEGVEIRELLRFSDDRGWLTELFRSDELPSKLLPEMAYLSMTKPGVSRGPHEHRDQSDLIIFMGNSRFRLYLWDNRPKSGTFKTHERFESEPGKTVAVRIPPGVVHGYKNIGDSEGLIINCPNGLYKGKRRSGEVDEIRHEEDSDSEFKIVD